MAEANSIGVIAATGQLVAQTTVAVARATDRSLVAEIMGRARAWFEHKPSVELAQIIGCDVRTAERYFAGDRTPAAENIIALIRSDVGARLIEEATASMAPADRSRFWKEMAKATLRAMIRENNEAD